MANATAYRVDSDLDAQSPAADLVRVYLNGIGKTALLTAADEVELAKRIEAGLYAQHLLDTRKRLGEARKRDLAAVAAHHFLAHREADAQPAVRARQIHIRLDACAVKRIAAVRFDQRLHVNVAGDFAKGEIAHL